AKAFLMNCLDGQRRGPWPAKDQGHGNERQRSDGQEPKGVVESEHARLALDFPVSHRDGGLLGENVDNGLVRLEPRPYLGEEFLEGGVVRCDVLHKKTLMHLASLGKDGGGEGHAETASQV